MFTSLKKKITAMLLVTQSRNVLICLFVRVVVNDVVKRFVVKLELHGNLSANSIGTSRDRIQFYDKKHNNIDNNLAKRSKWDRCVTTIVKLCLSFVSF